MRKYDLKNFTFTILEICTEAELDDREIYWIQYFDTYNHGYNQTCGGSRPPNTGKATYQWSLDGELIKIWISGNEAAIALGISRQSIYQAIHQRRPTACGFYWTRGEKPEIIDNYFNLIHSINQYDLDGTWIAKYSNAIEAEYAVTGNTKSRGANIITCCRGKTKTAYGFQWRKGIQQPEIITRKKIGQYSLTGELIHIWASINEAALQLGFSQGSLWGACNGRRKTAYGYKWEYIF